MSEQDILYKKAQTAMENRNYDRALALYEKIYALQSNLNINYNIFKLLTLKKEYRQAVVVANEYVTDYLNDQLKCNEYFNALLKGGLVLNAFKLYSKLQKILTSTDLKVIEDKLKNYPQYLSDKQRTQKNKTIYELQYLGAYQLSKQQQILKQIQLLNPQELFLNTKQALVDPNIACIVRMSLLNTLREVSNNEVEVLDINNQLIKTDLKHLPRLENIRNYQQLQNIIKSQSSVPDDLQHIHLAMLQLKAMLLYPELSDYQLAFLKNVFFKDQSKSASVKELRKRIADEIAIINDLS